MITIASLFDGIGGFPKAGERYGVKTLWASEIEPFPISVTKIRFPDMKHVGDITKLNGSKLPPVDIVCGGSPCQDVSQAGCRAGLAGARSGLFFEQIRLIKELRDADKKRGRTDKSVRPRYMFFENVPGLLSSGSNTARTSVSFSRKSAALQHADYLFLDLRAGGGNLLGPCWEKNSPSLGEWSTLNTGLSHSGARESSLSRILEAIVQARYYLSKTACLGILRRAKRRGKKLPTILEKALKMQAGLR